MKPFSYVEGTVLAMGTVLVWNNDALVGEGMFLPDNSLVVYFFTNVGMPVIFSHEDLLKKELPHPFIQYYKDQTRWVVQ